MLVVLLLVLTDSVSYVHATTNAVTPEVGENSWIVATRWPLPPAAGQIVLVQEGAQTRLYRVLRIDAGKREAVLGRNGETERIVKLRSIQGTIVLAVSGSKTP
jgi:hypothetical protein